MKTLIALSLLPYIWWLLGTRNGEFISAPGSVISILGFSCIFYHAMFLYACKKFPYSFMAATYMFFWIFMGFAPLIFSLTGRWLWGDITKELQFSIIRGAGLCALFIAVFQSFHYLGYKRGVFGRILMKPGSVSDFSIFVGLSVSLLASILVFVVLGVSRTFFRSGFEDSRASGSLTLLIQYFIRPMPLLIGVPCLWALLKQKSAFNRIGIWMAVATVFIALVVNLPLSTARFYGWMTLGILFYYYYLKAANLRRIWLAGGFLIAGFIGSFLVESMRYARTFLDAKETFSSAEMFSTDGFYAGHLDAFEQLTYGIGYVDSQGVSMGKQLLGVVLFWVPRESWPTKPVATGELLGSSYINLLEKTKNTNLSAPIVLEGYMNFGAAGVVLFAVAIGYFSGALDRSLIERRKMAVLVRDNIYIVDAIAAPLIGLWLYFLRGSLLATFSYSFTIVVSSLFVWLLIFRQRSATPRVN